jgi:hypothetical protein
MGQMSKQDLAWFCVRIAVVYLLARAALLLPAICGLLIMLIASSRDQFDDPELRIFINSSLSGLIDFVVITLAGLYCVLRGKLLVRVLCSSKPD